MELLLKLSCIPDIDEAICVSPPNSEVGESSDSVEVALALDPGTERKLCAEEPSRNALGEETL
jgi:hypothetical protein